MSTQTEINEALVQYLQTVGYREDKIISELENETLKLGSVSQMQIAKEQGQFLEMITKISNCLLYTSPSPRDAIPSRMPSSA